MTKYRIWGGWLLVILGVGVLMTMGCEKGALGVRPGTVVGTFVNAETGAPISNVRVQLVSEQGITSGGGGAPLGQLYVTTTDGNGRFAIDNLLPDKLLLQANHPSYQDYEYPSASATVKNFFVNNGQVVELGLLRMAPNPTVVTAENIVVKLIVRDAVSLEKFADNELVSLFIDGKEYLDPTTGSTPTVRNLADGITLTSKSGDLALKIQADPNRYLVNDTLTIPGNTAVVKDVYLQPLTYNITLRCLNVPDYVAGPVAMLWAEKLANGVPKILATQTAVLQASPVVGNANSPVVPNIISLKGIAMPDRLRFAVRGYEDEVITIATATIPAGSQGNISIEVDFAYNNDKSSFTYRPTVTADTKAGLLDNRILRPVLLTVAGKDFYPQTDYVVGHVYSFSQSWKADASFDPLPAFRFDYELSRTNPPDLQLIPVGYEQAYWVSLYPDPNSTSANAASGSFSVGDTFMVNPDNDNPPLVQRDVMREIAADPLAFQDKVRSRPYLLLTAKADRAAAATN